jgi:hypothetical protein
MTVHVQPETLPVVEARSRRTAGAIAFLVAAATAAAPLVYAPGDVVSDGALRAYLVGESSRMFLAWVLITVAGLAWLVFVVVVHRMLPPVASAALFLVAAVAGQAASWTGVSLSTAPAAPGAETMSLPVYTAFAEAGHLAAAAGTAGLGLALIALAVAMRSEDVMPRAVVRFTATCGVILVPGAVVGPVGIPLELLWLVVAGSALVARSVTRTDSLGA